MGLPYLSRSGLEKRFILILVQFLEIFFLKFFEEVEKESKKTDEKGRVRAGI